MEFRLCYKSYAFKPSLKAMKEFKEATGLDLWSSLTKYMVEFNKLKSDGFSVGYILHELSKVLDFVTAAQLFYCLAKQENSRLSIDEIEDAMFNVGILPSEREHDLSEPYPFVLYKLSVDIHEYHSQLVGDSKKK